MNNSESVQFRTLKDSKNYFPNPFKYLNIKASKITMKGDIKQIHDINDLSLCVCGCV